MDPDHIREAREGLRERGKTVGPSDYGTSEDEGYTEADDARDEKSGEIDGPIESDSDDVS